VPQLKIWEHPPSTVRNVNGRPREVPKLKIWERPPSTLRNVDGRPPGFVGARDSGVPTINAKKRQWRALWEVPKLALGLRARSACGACPSGRAVNGCRNLRTNIQRVVRTHFTLTQVGHFC
jgi:hypothetical protein